MRSIVLERINLGEEQGEVDRRIALIGLGRPVQAYLQGVSAEHALRYHQAALRFGKEKVQSILNSTQTKHHADVLKALNLYSTRPVQAALLEFPENHAQVTTIAKAIKRYGRRLVARAIGGLAPEQLAFFAKSLNGYQSVPEWESINPSRLIYLRNKLSPHEFEKFYQRARKCGVQKASTAQSLAGKQDLADTYLSVLKTGGVDPLKEHLASIPKTEYPKYNSRYDKAEKNWRLDPDWNQVARNLRKMGRLAASEYPFTLTEVEVPYALRAAFKHGAKTTGELLEQVNYGYRAMAAEALCQYGPETVKAVLEMGVNGHLILSASKAIHDKAQLISRKLDEKTGRQAGKIRSQAFQQAVKEVESELQKDEWAFSAMFRAHKFNDPQAAEQSRKITAILKKALRENGGRPLDKKQALDAINQVRFKTENGKRVQQRFGTELEDMIKYGIIPAGLDSKKIRFLDDATKNAFAYAELARKGVDVPESRIMMVPFTRSSYRREDEKTLALFPSQNYQIDLAFRGAHMKGHVPYSAGYVHFRIQDGKLIVSEIQSDLRYGGATNTIRRKYKDWYKILYMSLNKYATEHGLDEIWIPTAEHQLRAWPELDEPKAIELYADNPSKLGFTLTQTSKPIAAGKTTSNLYWRKTVCPQSNLQRDYGNLLLETTKSTKAKLKTRMLTRNKK